MFDLSPEPGEQLKQSVAGENAFRTLLGFIVESQSEGAFPAGDPYPMALMAWSLVHGIAKLANSGQFPFTQEQVLELTLQAAEALIEGMGRYQV
jgi:hypothetical protein